MRHCDAPLLCAIVMAPLLCAIVTWKVEQPPLLCAIVMRHLLCCVVLGLVCYLSPWMQRQPVRGPGLCSEPADPRDARLGQALVEVLCAICCVAFARHCCVAFGGISPFGDFQCALARCPGKPMDVPVQLKQYKGQEDEVYDKALQRR